MQNKHLMKFRAEINVMPLKALLDPQGKAVTGSMKNIGLPEIENVYCTKIASRFARTYTDSHSLRALVGEVLKIDLKHPNDGIKSKFCRAIRNFSTCFFALLIIKQLL